MQLLRRDRMECWLEGWGGERRNWRWIKRTQGFQKQRRGARKGSFERSSRAHTWPWGWASVTPHISGSYLGQELRREVSPTFVAVKEWGVTGHTSMSDMSEQLAGRPWIWPILTLAICSFTTELDYFNWWNPPWGGCESVLEEANKGYLVKVPQGYPDIFSEKLILLKKRWKINLFCAGHIYYR